MIIFTNSKGEIHDVGSTADLTLTPIEVTDGTFDTWTVAKICCYKVRVQDGNVVMLTPYVDSRLIEHIDQLGKQAESAIPWTATKTAYIDDTECLFEGVPQGNVTVYCSVPHTVEKQDNRVVVKFEALTEVIEITISIL